LFSREKAAWEEGYLAAATAAAAGAAGVAASAAAAASAAGEARGRKRELRRNSTFPPTSWASSRSLSFRRLSLLAKDQREGGKRDNKKEVSRIGRMRERLEGGREGGQQGAECIYE